jgi:hypothetical protein
MKKNSKTSNSGEPAEEFDDPNWTFWASKSYWTTDEAAALINGNDPHTMLKRPAEVLEHFAKMKQIIELALHKQVLTHPIRPIQIVDFFRQASRFGVHPKLEKAMVEFTSDPEKSFSALALRCADLEKQLEKLKKEAELAKPLDPRERKTLLMLLCGLSHIHYRYDPDKRGIATEIRGKLIDLGIKLSDDAVRGALKSAYELLPHHLVE